MKEFKKNKKNNKKTLKNSTYFCRFLLPAYTFLFINLILISGCSNLKKKLEKHFFIYKVFWHIHHMFTRTIFVVMYKTTWCLLGKVLPALSSSSSSSLCHHFCHFANWPVSECWRCSHECERVHVLYPHHWLATGPLSPGLDSRWKKFNNETNF